MEMVQGLQERKHETLKSKTVSLESLGVKGRITDTKDRNFIVFHSRGKGILVM